jgi:hypothetical protein
VVPESPTAQDSSAEEQQQPKDHDIEDKANEEYPPPSNAEDEKMYQDADEVKSFGIKAPVLACRLRALLEHLGITTAVIPHSEKEGTKPPYVCPGCSNHTYSNNMITRIHVQ